DLGEVHEWLFSLGPSDVDKLHAALNSLSGEVYAALPTLASRRLEGMVAGAHHCTVGRLRPVGAGERDVAGCGGLQLNPHRIGAAGGRRRYAVDGRRLLCDDRRGDGAGGEV